MPWKVPIHMPRTPSPITFSTRPRISAAALLVKVTAMMEKGEQRSTCISQAIRCTSTRVLPEPAPASTSRLLRGAATASLCLSLSPSSRVETSITTPVYLYRRRLYGLSGQRPTGRINEGGGDSSDIGPTHHRRSSITWRVVHPTPDGQGQNEGRLRANGLQARSLPCPPS
ncbi:hypothetical protein D3C84_419810 [compost metagenome]